MRKVLAVVEDLFFTVKIQDAAKRAGVAIEFVKRAEGVLEKAKEQPGLILFDLNFAAVDPVATIRSLKASDETKGIRLAGYVSHVRVDLKQQAMDAGCDTVLARSVLAENLPEILKLS